MFLRGLAVLHIIKVININTRHFNYYYLTLLTPNEYCYSGADNCLWGIGQAEERLSPSCCHLSVQIINGQFEKKRN